MIKLDRSNRFVCKSMEITDDDLKFTLDSGETVEFSFEEEEFTDRWDICVKHADRKVYIVRVAVNDGKATALYPASIKTVNSLLKIKIDEPIIRNAIKLIVSQVLDITSLKELVNS